MVTRPNVFNQSDSSSPCDNRDVPRVSFSQSQVTSGCWCRWQFAGSVHKVFLNCSNGSERISPLGNKHGPGNALLSALRDGH